MAKKRKRAVVKDYKGDNYVRGRRRSTPVSKETTQSFRCRDCNQLAYLTPREWQRAAKPHCTGCGGPLIETEPSVQRTIGDKNERRRAENTVKAAIENVRQNRRCWSCGQQFLNGKGVADHVKEQSECLYEYRMDKKTFRVFEGTAKARTVLPGTADWFKSKTGGRPWWVQAAVLHPTGQVEYMVIEQFDRQTLAQELVDTINAAGKKTETTP